MLLQSTTPGSESCPSQIHLIMFFDLNIDILVALHSGPLESHTTLNVSMFFLVFFTIKQQHKTCILL